MDASEFDEIFAASLSRVTGHVYAMLGDHDEAQGAPTLAALLANNADRTGV